MDERDLSRAPGELGLLARDLRVSLPSIPSGYEPGLEALCTAVRTLTGCSPETADRLVERLIEAGWVRYAAAGRSIGTAAPWTYERLDSDAYTA